MLFSERLQLQKLLRSIAVRKEYIKEFWESYYYLKFRPHHLVPNWDFSSEIANDKELNRLYFKADYVLKNEPVDENTAFAKSMLMLA